MKSDTLRTSIFTAFLSWLLSFGIAGCLATAFQIPLIHGAGRLALLCGIFALVMTFAFRQFHTAIPVTVFLSAQLFLLYFLQQAPLQMQVLLPHITGFFHRAYGWPVLLRNPVTALHGDLAVLRLTLVVCFFLCWTLSRRKNLVLTLLPLSPLACCVVVCDTVPDAKYLAALLFGVLLLLFTHRARRQVQSGDWSSLGLKLAPVTALMLALLLLVAPPAGGINPLRLVFDKAMPWINDLMAAPPGTGSGSGSGIIVGPSTAPGINLSTLGPKTQSNDVVLYATTARSQLTYLRHRVMSHYTGTSWNINRRVGQGFGQTATDYNASDRITIRTPIGYSYRYIPYFPISPVQFNNGFARNDGAATEYFFNRTDSFRVKLADMLDSEIYHDLPDSTRDWAEDLVASIIGDATDTATKAKRIGDYVRNSATYSLNTPVMPSYSSDFVKWFLEDSDTGYCVHFATAATVLLRAAGIPAQYVEGLTFMSGKDGEETPVLSSNAHAWVEYYDENNYCHILDPTPADGIPDDPYTPDNPDKPDTPDNPDKPDTPDTPDDPDKPDTPDDPNTPDGPAQPDTPDLPIMTPDDYPPTVHLGRILWSVAGISLLLLFAQALLRRRNHRRNWNRGENNARALERYRQCRLFARFCKMELPENLVQLAGKARFSQHQLTEEELAQFDDFMQKARFAAKAGPLYRKLLRFFVAAI